MIRAPHRSVASAPSEAAMPEWQGLAAQSPPTEERPKEETLTVAQIDSQVHGGRGPFIRLKVAALVLRARDSAVLCSTSRCDSTKHRFDYSQYENTDPGYAWGSRPRSHCKFDQCYMR